ncbi:hypothetical protein Tco_1494275 [Tanacetum coccineum]
MVEANPDVIHFDNSSDLTLSTSLNDLDFETLHIDGQSTDVDAPPYIIDVDEDDDIIDDEDALPHDLAYSDDEVLVNVDDDDVAVVYSNVAQGHGSDGSGDDHPHSHQESGQAAYPPGDLEPQVKEDHGCTWPRPDYGVSDVLPFLAPGPAEWKAGVLAKIETQFDLKPHMESERWLKIYTGIQQHLQKIYNGNKSALKAHHWVQNLETGTYNVESIRRGRPANIFAADWDAQNLPFGT